MEDKTDIQFTCAYLSFLNTFAVETNKEINSENAIKKLLEGTTTYHEVLRVTWEQI